MSKVIIREAEERDVLDCLILIKNFAKESKQPFKFDTRKTLETINNSVNNISPVKFFVAELNSEVVGFISAIVYEQLFSRDKTADELAWYVDKSHRGGTAAIRLLKAYEDWAKNNGVICINLSHIEDLTDLTKLYNRLGYRKIEATFRRDV